MQRINSFLEHRIPEMEKKQEMLEELVREVEHKFRDDDYGNIPLEVSLGSMKKDYERKIEVTEEQIENSDEIKKNHLEQEKQKAEIGLEMIEQEQEYLEIEEEDIEIEDTEEY